MVNFIFIDYGKTENTPFDFCFIIQYYDHQFYACTYYLFYTEWNFTVQKAKTWERKNDHYEVIQNMKHWETTILQIYN